MPRINPHSYTDSRQTHEIRDLHLRLQVDFKERRLHGRVTLRLECPAAGALDLDTRDLAIERVTSQGADLSWYLGQRDSILGSRLRVELPPGAQSIDVFYATSPKASALQWLEPRQTAGGSIPTCSASASRSTRARSAPAGLGRGPLHLPRRGDVPEPLLAVMSAAPGACRPDRSRGAHLLASRCRSPFPPT